MTDANIEQLAIEAAAAQQIATAADKLADDKLEDLVDGLEAGKETFVQTEEDLH